MLKIPYGLSNFNRIRTKNFLYVNLKRLARADTQAGELANVLIGNVKTPTDPEVKLILKNLKESFEVFREDKKVRDQMNIIEMERAEERAKLLPIITEKDEQLAELREQLAEQSEQMAELKAQLAKQMS